MFKTQGGPQGKWYGVIRTTRNDTCFIGKDVVTDKPRTFLSPSKCTVDSKWVRLI